MPLRLYVGILLLLTSCGAEPSRLQHMADEGLAITQRVNFSATPEAKLQVAQELLTHASLYDQLISRATTLDRVARARGFQRLEREAASALMREAATDYVKRKDLAHARHVFYQSILTTFPQDEYRPIRILPRSSSKHGTSAMKWTTDKPTRPGFYWNQGEGTKQSIFEVRDDGHGLYIVQTGKALIDVQEDEYRWAGPILEPTEGGT